MAASDVRQTIVQIVNAVLRKLFLNTVTNTTDTKQSTLMVQFLNEVVVDINDSGDWQEFLTAVQVSAVSGQHTYELGLTSPIKSILEIAVSGQIQSLYYTDIRDINRLVRVSSEGTPRWFSLFGLDSQENPKFKVSPIPGSNEDGQRFTIHYYEKPRLYTTSDDAVSPDLPANLLIQGLYAKTLLHEAGGEPTQEYQAEFQLYERLKQQAFNRYNVDTGTDIFFVPDRYPSGPR
jgi:hypothetical protein